ncbi:MAG: D-alanyl-D-alanine carboxypeptidase [Clostridia bacterium]|nr:D-alanyl-D-alanine carboxypeptidase [Clostridia bacterium]
MNKKIFITVCCFAILACVVVGLGGGSDVGTVSADVVKGINSSSLLMDFASGTVIHELNASQRRPIASMVKIMTLLRTYESIASGKASLEDDVTISQRAADMGGSQAFLDAGSVHKLKNLIKTIIVASANDSCVAVAEHISGSVENFVDSMNKRAGELGLKDTNFVNCTGLPATNQYSCARDVATMMRTLISTESNYFEYSKIWMEDFVHPGGRVTGLTNTNRLIRFYQGCDGGKTGYTNEAKHCLCATAKRGETRLIAVVVGAPDSQTRFKEVSDLLNYGFGNYESKVMLAKDGLEEIQIKSGVKETLKIAPAEQLALFGKKGETKGELVIDLHDVKAPVKKGDAVGYALIVAPDGSVLAKTDIVALEDIEKQSFFDTVRDILGQW